MAAHQAFYISPSLEESEGIQRLFHTFAQLHRWSSFLILSPRTPVAVAFLQAVERLVPAGRRCFVTIGSPPGGVSAPACCGCHYPDKGVLQQDFTRRGIHVTAYLSPGDQIPDWIAALNPEVVTLTIGQKIAA